MTFWQAVLWTTAFGAPAGTIAGLTFSRRGLARETAHRRRVLDKWAALSLLPAGILAALGPAAGTVHMPWLLLGTEFEIDQIGRPLLLVAVLLYAAAVTTVHTSQIARPHILIGFLLACFLGNAGVFVAADVVTFYLSFSVMSVAAYGVIVHTGSDAARRAGRIYLGMTIFGEMLILCALVMIVDTGGFSISDAPAAVAASDNRDVIVALLLVGFAIKAGTVPMHVWLPLAHPAAPPPASAVLSGAMVKAGLVGWLRFLPLGELAMPGWGSALIVLALIGAFAALPIGVLQNDPKVSLAYSTISQMGFLAVLVGAALASPELASACILAAVVYAVHHAMAKGGLFLSVSIWKTHGAGRARWWILGAMTLLALAVAGAPLGSGAVAKYAAKEAITPAGLAGFDLTELLPWVGTVSTLLVLRAGYLLFNGPVGPAHRADSALWAWFSLCVGGSIVTWLLAEQWVPLLSVPALDAVTVWDATWPILIGVVVATLFWQLARHRSSPRAILHPDGTMLPPGDIVVLAERLSTSAVRSSSAAHSAVPSSSAVQDAVSHATRTTAEAVGARSDTAERSLSAWAVSGVAIVATLLLLVLLVVLT